MVKLSKSEQRSLTEKHQKVTYDLIKKELNQFYVKNFGRLSSYVMVYSKKAQENKKYFVLGYNNLYSSWCIYLNFCLSEENKKLKLEVAKRAAIKLYLAINHQEFQEMSPTYRVLAQKFFLWNYGFYSEIPQKWFVYSCSICSRQMAAFPKALPTNNELRYRKTPLHTKDLRDGSLTNQKSHQGNYAFQGKVELTNAQLQKVLFIMQKSHQFEKKD